MRLVLIRGWQREDLGRNDALRQVVDPLEAAAPRRGRDVAGPEQPFERLLGVAPFPPARSAAFFVKIRGPPGPSLRMRLRRASASARRSFANSRRPFQPISPRSARAIRQRSRGCSARGKSDASCAQYSNSRRLFRLPQAACRSACGRRVPVERRRADNAPGPGRLRCRSGEGRAGRWSSSHRAAVAFSGRGPPKPWAARAIRRASTSESFRLSSPCISSAGEPVHAASEGRRGSSVTPARSRSACRRNPSGAETGRACRGRRFSGRRRRARARRRL